MGLYTHVGLILKLIFSLVPRHIILIHRCLLNDLRGSMFVVHNSRRTLMLYNKSVIRSPSKVRCIPYSSMQWLIYMHLTFCIASIADLSWTLPFYGGGASLLCLILLRFSIGSSAHLGGDRPFLSAYKYKTTSLSSYST